MKKNKKKIILSGVVLVTVGMSGIFFLQDKEPKELDKNVKEELSAYNYDANNILDNVFEENDATILPIIYNNSYETISKEKIEQYFKNAGVNVKDISTNEIGTGTVITTDEKKYTVIVYGDVDGDGIVDTFDAQNILLHRVFGHNYELKGIYKIAANVYNDDDEIDVFDAQKILEFRIGNEEELVLYPPVSNKEKDKEPPVIELNGNNPQVVEVHNKYVEAGATVTDNYDTNLIATIDASKVNVDVVGEYEVTYNAKDMKGNVAKQVIRKVQVVDTTAPVITVSEDNVYTMEVNTTKPTFTATAQDNYDTNVKVVITDDINTEVVGTYTVTFTAIDANNNTATQTKEFKVVDTTKPEITLNGANPQVIEVHNEYTELGASITDNYDTNLIATIDASEVNTDVVGTYTVKYNVTDANGNIADEATRTVQVKDTTKPEITLNGENPQVIEVHETYTELGATVTDNYDKGLTATINTDAVNTEIVGIYTVTYNVTDANGNIADEVTRTVKVVDTTKPEITLKGDNPQVIELGSKYTELGAIVTDNYNRNIKIEIDSSNVNTSEKGQYVVKYNATDASGNKAKEVTRTVIVRKSVYVTGIEIVKEPDNCNYKYGHTIDTTGLQVYAKMSNGETKDVTSSVVFDINKATANKVTVKYTTTDTSDFSSKDFTATFDINVINYIVGIKIVNNPDIVEYVENENISLNGIKVVAIKADGNEDEEITVTTRQEQAVFGTNVVTVEYTTTNTKDDTSRTFTDTFDINVVYPISTITVLPINVTGYRYDEVDIATISSGENQKEITLDDTIECKIVKDDREINNTEAEISYSANNNSSITGQLVITMKAKSTGNYTITPKVNGIEASSSITVVIKENPIVTDVKLGGYTTTDTIRLPSGEKTQLQLTFIHKYSESEKAEIEVTYNRLTAEGTNYEFLYKDAEGGISEVTSGNVNMIAITPSQSDTLITISVNNNGTIKEFEFAIEPVLVTKSIETVSTIRFADIAQDGVSVEDNDGVVFTLVPIALKDNLGNETSLTKADFEGTNNIITITYNGDKTDEFCAIANKYYYRDDEGHIKEAQSNDAKVEYIGFSKDWTPIEELAQYPIVITYNGVATNITITE